MKRAAFPIILILMILLLSCGGSTISQDTRALNPHPDDCSVYPPQATSPYVLPYPVGTSHMVATTTAHGGVRKYAIDFLMPIGSTITAARPGTVYEVEQNFYDTQHELLQANYVFVLHDDNTLGLYGHLTHNGAFVSVGDAVKQGQSLGLSGDSGVSTQPHLHFEVVRCNVTGWSNGLQCPDANTVGVPVLFANTTSTPCGMDVDTWYVAEPYQ